MPAWLSVHLLLSLLTLKSLHLQSAGKPIGSKQAAGRGCICTRLQLPGGDAGDHEGDGIAGGRGNSTLQTAVDLT